MVKAIERGTDRLRMQILHPHPNVGLSPGRQGPFHCGDQLGVPETRKPDPVLAKSNLDVIQTMGRILLLSMLFLPVGIVILLVMIQNAPLSWVHRTDMLLGEKAIELITTEKTRTGCYPEKLKNIAPLMRNPRFFEKFYYEGTCDTFKLGFSTGFDDGYEFDSTSGTWSAHP